MKRNALGDREKETKKLKLLEQLGDAHLQYVTPRDNGFYNLWKTKYAKLIMHDAEQTPAKLHQIVQKAFLTLLKHGCLFQDLVQLKGKDLLTPVSRILIGQPGCTYKYLNTRLFAVPWLDDKSDIKYSTEDIRDACKAFYELNDFLFYQTKHELHSFSVNKQNTDTFHVSSEKIPFQDGKQSNHQEVELFNVTLINYMNPQNMPYLREEPYFGMGKMAVSWHHDENLVEQSTVAVYNYSQDRTTEIYEEEVESKWHVGLKVAWDIETPGLALPLNSGDSYFMLEDLNNTHQHCVLAGSHPRFSSTHRVAQCNSGTLQYIQSRCKSALENLHVFPGTGQTTLKYLETTVLHHAEQVHNEVEFDWLRQFWFQGNRYTKCSDFWVLAMADLEDQWRQLETLTSLVIEELVKVNWTLEERDKILTSILPLLSERHDLRQKWQERCRCKLAMSLPVDQRPQCCPYWKDGEKSMPLPFDLSTILSQLENLTSEKHLETNLP